MEKITVTVGLTEKNYSAHLIIGDGIVVATAETFENLKKEMQSAVEFHLEGMLEDGDTIPAAFLKPFELVYQFDTESLLSHYKGIISNAALERLTGINRRQLTHYASGLSKPRPPQRKKIAAALHRLGKELLEVEL
jgi:predicted RNase H-like HicB family nuclease